MKTIANAIFAAVLTAASLAASAQATAPAAAAAKSNAEFTEAEVRKVDKENKKVTLKHGEIKNLQMPAMTMVFQVADAGVLDNLKAGDKVRFKASNEGGKFTVTDIQPSK